MGAYYQAFLFAFGIPKCEQPVKFTAFVDAKLVDQSSFYTNVFNSTSFLFLLIWLYTIYVVKPFSVIGSVEFHTSYLTTIIPANGTSETIAYSDITQLAFYHNETKGDSYSGAYVGVGALRTKDGINNYIDINGRRYQVEIESKAKLFLMRNTIEMLQSKGVNAEIYK